MKELEGIARATLSNHDQMSYDLLLRELRDEIERMPFQFHLVPINRRAGIQTIDGSRTHCASTQ